jgi:small subunit ribosomal protein S9
MPDEENKETSEETPSEEPQAETPEEPQAQTPEEPQAQTPEEPQAQTPEEPQAQTPEEPQAQTPPEDAPADPGREAEESAVDGEAQPSADDDRNLTSSEEAEGPADTAGSPDEGPADAAESPAEAPAPAAREKAEKKDVIPGADLEPIAVEKPERELSAEERARLEAEEEERAKREAQLAGEDEDEEAAASRAPAKMESGSSFRATGKRKNAIARVTLVPGDGKFEVNKRSLEDFFPRPLHQTMAKQPLSTTGYEGTVDVRVRVHGGGIGGQAGAVRHGIARALTEIDAELRGELKRRGFLTRDARVKERRKAGLKKARKRPQFSKR